MKEYLIRLEDDISPTDISHIDEDGAVWVCHHYGKLGETTADSTIVEVPPHEKLTEKSSFWNMLHEICVKCNDSGDINRYPNRCIWCKIKDAYEKVYKTPTVLEASK